jgi:hypothetical protein
MLSDGALSDGSALGKSWIGLVFFLHLPTTLSERRILRQEGDMLRFFGTGLLRLRDSFSRSTLMLML